jgi:uncharacterized protein (UPF0305 family)
MSLCLKTVRNVIDRLGGDSSNLALSNASEDLHMKDLMEIASHLEDRAKYSSSVEMRKKLLKKVIAAEIPLAAKNKLVEEIFEIELPKF